jgi:hypothetical protein
VQRLVLELDPQEPREASAASHALRRRVRPPASPVHPEPGPSLVDARFLGGEPFLNRLNFKVWELLAELNPKARVCITTNGTVLTDKIKELLLRTRPEINVSLESLLPGNYEAIRVNGDAEKLKANLQWLLDHELLNSISVCPIRQNWRDLPHIVSFCNRNRVPVWFNMVVEPAHVSMRNMDAAELEMAIWHLGVSRLDKGPPVPPGKLDAEEVNRRRFHSLMQLLVAWKRDAELREAGQSANLRACHDAGLPLPSGV